MLKWPVHPSSSALKTVAAAVAFALMWSWVSQWAIKVPGPCAFAAALLNLPLSIPMFFAVFLFPQLIGDIGFRFLFFATGLVYFSLLRVIIRRSRRKAAARIKCASSDVQMVTEERAQVSGKDRGFVSLCCLAVMLVYVFWPYRGRLGPNDVADETGVYQLPDGGELRVKIDSEGMINYRLLDSTGKDLLTPTYKPSAFHRWYFVYDERQWLWFWNSDMGGDVWKPGPQQRYVAHPLPDDLRSAPNAFQEKLPDSIKRRLF